MEEVYKKIGENVRKIRENKKISQLELAEMIGHKSTTIISQGELGKKHFNIEHLYKISKVLDISICEFFKGVE